jgi:D-alanine-D-alanine ligase-like ATP-grasp enzyme
LYYFNIVSTVFDSSTAELCKVAIGAAAALGLDMAGVDLLERGDSRYCVCEVNAAAGIEVCLFLLHNTTEHLLIDTMSTIEKAFEHATGQDVALALIQYCYERFQQHSKTSKQ